MIHDIVKLLRDVPQGIGGHYHHLMQKAADEIERLRETLRVEQEELAACCIDRKETQRERDEARREICLLRASSTNATETISAEMDEYARSRGWECFEDVKK